MGFFCYVSWASFIMWIGLLLFYGLDLFHLVVWASFIMWAGLLLLKRGLRDKRGNRLATEMAATAAAAAGVAVAGDRARRRQWRYTWESLAHLPLLRLYLFRPELSAAAAADHLRADLRLDDSLLLLSFSLAGEPVALRVPVPRVLVDPSAPPECRDAGDHVEVRLALVLPVDHPVVAAAFLPPPGEEPPAPLSLGDGELLVCFTVL